MIKSLAKSVLTALRLTAAASAANEGIHEKILGSGNDTTIYDLTIMKIVKSFEDSGLLLKGVNERRFLSMLLGTLRSRLLRDTLTGKVFIRPGYGYKEKGKIRAGYESKDLRFKDF